MGIVLSWTQAARVSFAHHDPPPAEQGTMNGSPRSSSHFPHPIVPAPVSVGSSRAAPDDGGRHLTSCLRRALAPAGALLAGLVLSSGASGSGEVVDLPTVEAVYTANVRLPGPGVRGLQWLGDRLWVVATANESLGAPDSSFSAALVRLDPETGAADTVSVEVDGYESGLAFDGQFLWSGGSLIGQHEGLYEIDPQTGEILLTLPGSGVHPAGLAWDGTYLWQADSDARKLYRIEIEEGKISRKFPSPGFYPTGLTYDGFHFWCADASTGRLYRLKAHNGRADGVVSEDVFYRPGEFVSLAWDGRALWTASAADTVAQRLELLR